MDEQKQILVVGGGYAGIAATKVLDRRYRRNRNVGITLIDRNRFHTLMTDLHEVAGERVPQASVKVSYDRIFSGSSVNVVHDEIIDVDLDDHRVIGKTGVYKWDRVLFATGGAPADFNIEGVSEHTLSLWSLDDALKIRRHLEATFRRAALERDEQKRRELMSVVVAGAGFTGVELVGELLESLPMLCRKYALPEDEVKLINLEALGSILVMLPEEVREKAVRYMQKKAVEIRTNALIVKATENAFHLKDGSIIKAATKIWTCGVRGNWFTPFPKLKEGKAGRLEVDEFMRSPGFEDVYIAGDGIWFLENGRPVPQIVEAALQTAEVAAHNIMVDIDKMLRGKSGKHEVFRGSYHGFMVSIGSKYAVSHTGGISLSGFLAMALKHMVNLHYLFTLGGLNVVRDYLKHEFLDIRQGRSPIGSFAEWKIPNYWVLPLRIYLGVMWMIEGIRKVFGGWLYRANDFVSVSLTGTAADAASTATELVEGADAVANQSIEWGEALLAEPWSVYIWFSQWTVNQAPFLFQSGIVIFEILIGLAFIGGAFTWLAALSSLVFSIILIVGALTDATIFWYMAAALVMMGGAGRAFGLDYWIMPWVKKWWNGTTFARRTFLYVGEPTMRASKR